jgi:deoxyribonuclease V
MRWPTANVPTPRQAAELQRQWAAKVVTRSAHGPIATIAGVDVGVRDDVASAAVCVFSFPELELLETSALSQPVKFPYVPGLLGFREVPCIVAAFEKLERRPDLLLIDGHGLAHPRRFGVATHLCVELDMPGIGCAKSLLCGEYREPALKRGSNTRLVHQGEVIGRVVRTRDRVNPVFVSTGTRVDLASAVRIVLRCTRGYRLPEPIRAAHNAAALAGRKVK